MQFVRTVYQSIVDSIWDHTVVDGHVVAEDTITTQKRAVEVYRKHLLDMEQKNVDMKEFVYSRGLTSAPEKYKNKATPHVQAALQEIEAFERGQLEAKPQAGNRIKFVPVLRSHMKKRKAAECVVSAQLYDPKKHVLDRHKAVDDLINPLSQVCQAVGLDPKPMAEACKKKCRIEDMGIRQFWKGGGAASVPFSKCLLKDPMERKATQMTLGFGKEKPKAIVWSKGIHKKRMKK